MATAYDLMLVDMRTRTEIKLNSAPLSLADAKSVARRFCGNAWIMDRRPLIHTWSNVLALRIDIRR